MSSESASAPDERPPLQSRVRTDGDGDAVRTDGGDPESTKIDGSTDDEKGNPDGDERTDGGDTPVAHTIHVELVDEPGQLLAALKPIADNGGNLLSVFHERGNITPRGHIPVAVDLECPTYRFETILQALRENGVNVIRAGAEEFGVEMTVVLVGHLIDTDLSDTLNRVANCANATVADVELSAPDGADSDEQSSARLRLRAREGETAEVLETVRAVAGEKGLHVIEPLEGNR